MISVLFEAELVSVTVPNGAYFISVIECEIVLFKIRLVNGYRRPDAQIIADIYFQVVIGHIKLFFKTRPLFVRAVRIIIVGIKAVCLVVVLPIPIFHGIFRVIAPHDDSRSRELRHNEKNERERRKNGGSRPEASVSLPGFQTYHKKGEQQPEKRRQPAIWQNRLAERINRLIVERRRKDIKQPQKRKDIYADIAAEIIEHLAEII